MCSQVKVWVGENLVHYYVLSRFLISRMLTVTKIPQMKVRGFSTHVAAAADIVSLVSRMAAADVSLSLHPVPVGQNAYMVHPFCAWGRL